MKNKEGTNLNQFKKIKASLLKEYSILDIGWSSIDKVTQLKGYEAYRDLKIDEQIKFCLFIKKILIIGKNYDIEGGTDEQRSFLKENIESLEPTLFSTLWNIMTAIDYGFSVSEILWEKRDGKIWLKGIKTVAPWDVDFEYDEFGHLQKMTISGEEMPIDKFLIISYFSEFGSLKGFPELASAWNPYYFKKMVQKFWLKHLERFGSPIIKGKVPKSASDEEVEKFFEDLNRLHFQTGIVIPQGRDQAENFDFELLESKREGGSQFYDAMEYSDNRIAKAFLLPSLFGASSIRFGSYALADKQFEVVYKIIASLQENLVSALNKKVIKPLIQFNYGVKEVPKLKFIPFTKEELTAIVKEMSKEFKKGGYNEGEQQLPGPEQKPESNE